LDVVCGKQGAAEVAFISFPMPLHIDHTYIGDGGVSEFSTQISYREGSEVVSRLSVIGDDGSSVFTRSAESFKPFIGKAIEVEDIFGHTHTFHFPSVSLGPLEGGCQKDDDVRQIEREARTRFVTWLNSDMGLTCASSH
jgi:hypothetical protein